MVRPAEDSSSTNGVVRSPAKLKCTPSYTLAIRCQSGASVPKFAGLPRARLNDLDLWNLWAAGRFMPEQVLFQPESLPSNASWADDLGRIVAVAAYGEFDNSEFYDPEFDSDELVLLDDEAGDPTVTVNGRPNRIELRCVVEQGGQTRSLTLTTDVAIIGEPTPIAEHNGIFVSPGATISIETLSDMLHRAMFYAWDDMDADSWETQNEIFAASIVARATEILGSEDDAIVMRVREQLRGAPWALRGRSATIRVPAGGGEIQVEIGAPHSG